PLTADTPMAASATVRTITTRRSRPVATAARTTRPQLAYQAHRTGLRRAKVSNDSPTAWTVPILGDRHSRTTVMTAAASRPRAVTTVRTPPMLTPMPTRWARSVRTWALAPPAPPPPPPSP